MKQTFTCPTCGKKHTVPKGRYAWNCPRCGALYIRLWL
jgi:ribosomal protein L37AE/L43A